MGVVLGLLAAEDTVGPRKLAQEVQGGIMASKDATAPELLAGKRVPRLGSLRVGGVAAAEDLLTTQVAPRLEELLGVETRNKAKDVGHKVVLLVSGVGRGEYRARLGSPT